MLTVVRLLVANALQYAFLLHFELPLPDVFFHLPFFLLVVSHVEVLQLEFNLVALIFNLLHHFEDVFLNASFLHLKLLLINKPLPLNPSLCR